MSVDIAYKVSLILVLIGDRVRSFCPDNIFRPCLDLNLINLDLETTKISFDRWFFLQIQLWTYLKTVCTEARGLVSQSFDFTKICFRLGTTTLVGMIQNAKVG